MSIEQEYGYADYDLSVVCVHCFVRKRSTVVM